MRSIWIYNGCGVSADSLKHTLHMFSLHTKIPTQLVTVDEVFFSNWDECALFVMPGGRDLPYVRSLKGKGIDNIKKYVEEGGSYLGICAGAYFAGSKVNFDEGGPLEIIGKRELAFYPGTVKGPTLKPFDYYSLKGAMATPLKWKEPVTVFFNGGGHFEEGEGNPIAYYPDGREAVIECQVKKGKAILSSVHFEYFPELMDEQNPYLKEIRPLISIPNLLTFQAWIIQKLLRKE